MKPGLSVCMIVKNEAANILAALESVSAIADEIVINDTGSTDGTEKITEVLKPGGPPVKMIHNPWEEDFGKARNQAMDHASHQWILTYDADDRIPETEVRFFKQLISGPADKAYLVRIKSAAAPQVPGHESFQIRLFPNRPDVRYRWRVHEQISHALIDAGIEIAAADAMILHTGYSKGQDVIIAKANRNLKIMLEENLDNPVRFSQVGEAYVMLSENLKAIPWFEKAYGTPNIETAYPDLHFCLPARIGYALLEEGDYTGAVQWFDKSPDNIECAYQKGRCYEKLEKFMEAVLSYYEAISKPKRNSLVCIDYDTCRIMAFHYASRLLICMRRHNEAVRLLAAVAKLYPQAVLDV